MSDVAPCVQAKLMLGIVGDSCEREADAVATRVAAIASAGGSLPSVGSVRLDDEFTKLVWQAPRQTAVTEASNVSTIPKAEQGNAWDRPDAPRPQLEHQTGMTAESLVGAAARLRGGGAAIPGPTREIFEQLLGADLRGVRVHTGSLPNQMARSISACAFTHGQDIAFAPGQYNPQSFGGIRLLAHELTHVLQQRAAPRLIRTSGHVQSSKGVQGPQAAPIEPPHAIQRHPDAATEIVAQTKPAPRKITEKERDQAALAALNAVHWKAQERFWEYLGIGYQNPSNGELGFGKPATSKSCVTVLRRDAIAQLSDPPGGLSSLRFLYHVHPLCPNPIANAVYNAYSLSSDDKNLAERAAVPLYWSDPTGLVRCYYPASAYKTASEREIGRLGLPRSSLGPGEKGG